MPARVAWAASCLSIALATGTNRGFAETGQSAAQLAALCASCHRADNKPNGIPPITSLNAQQIIEMTRGFRTRSNPAMRVVSRALSDTEIAAVAGYLSGRADKTGP